MGSLMDEELLQCSVCGRIFEDPRVLPCFHTVCNECLQKILADSTLSRCPIDGQEISPEYEAPKNHFLESILQKMEEKECKKKECNNECENTPTLWCESCGELCDRCSEQIHSINLFKKHEITQIKDKKGAIRLPHCSLHQHNKTDLYCTKCEVLLCHLCEKTSHIHHKCLPMDQTAKIKKSNLLSYLHTLTHSIEVKLQEDEHNRQSSISKCEVMIKNLIKEIEEMKHKLDMTSKFKAKMVEEHEAIALKKKDIHIIYQSIIKLTDEISMIDILDSDKLQFMISSVNSLFQSMYGEYYDNSQKKNLLHQMMRIHHDCNPPSDYHHQQHDHARDNNNSNSPRYLQLSPASSNSGNSAKKDSQSTHSPRNPSSSSSSSLSSSSSNSNNNMIASSSSSNNSNNEKNENNISINGGNRNDNTNNENIENTNINNNEQNIETTSSNNISSSVGGDVNTQVGGTVGGDDGNEDHKKVSVVATIEPSHQVEEGDHNEESDVHQTTQQDKQQEDKKVDEEEGDNNIPDYFRKAREGKSEDDDSDNEGGAGGDSTAGKVVISNVDMRFTTILHNVVIDNHFSADESEDSD